MQCDMDMTIYGGLIFSKRHELDKIAYAKYFDENWDSNTDDLREGALTFNKFYGTETHKRYLLPLLRKQKLEKINQIK